MTQGSQPLSHLPVYPRIELAESPIALALCQLKFPEKYSVHDKAVVGKFQDAIDKKYPVPSEGIIQNITLGGSLDRPGIESQNTSTAPLWEFRDPEAKWLVSLSSSQLSLECREYDGFDSFTDRFREIVQALIATIRPTTITRLGVRYVNEVRVPSINPVPENTIRAELLGPLLQEPFRGAARHSQSYINLGYGDAQVNFQYGVIAGGTTIAPIPGQEVSSEPFILLDFDVYKEFKATALNANNVINDVEDFHDIISRLFRWSVTDEFIESRRVQDNEGRNSDS